MEFDLPITTQSDWQTVASVRKAGVSKPDHGQSSRETISEPSSEEVVTVSDSALQRFAASKTPAPKISIEFDNDSNHIVVHVVDPESGEVIRQIPDEKFQALAQRIHDFQSLFLKDH